MKAKFVQIATDSYRVFALDADGMVWLFSPGGDADMATGAWKPLPRNREEPKWQA